MEELLDTPLEEKSRYGPKKFRSDKLRWIVLLLFLVGLFFKNRHWPGASPGLIGAALLAGIYASLQLGEGRKWRNPFKAYFSLSFAVAIIYLVFRLQFWPGATLLLVIALGLGLFLLVSLGIQKRQREYDKLALNFLALCVFVSTLSNSRLFYVVNMSETLNSYEHSSSSYAWDRYSMMLSAEGNRDLALKANDRAQQIAIAEDSEEALPELKQHRLEIERRP
jgi:hypothetical protein